MKNQVGAKFIAKQRGVMNNRFADNIIITAPKNSKLIRLTNNVVKRERK